MVGAIESKIDIMVIGGGGREHALCWKLAQSPLAKKIYCAPGNGGTALDKRITNVNLQVSDFDGIAEFALKNSVDFIVIGPDNPLADGIVDFLEEKGLKVFGPTKEAAKLEWSKAHSKTFMQQNAIPTARFEVSHDFESAEKFVRANSWARVIKADGLALGKGVFVCDSAEEAVDALGTIFKDGKFGDAGKTVVIEEKLIGDELSLLILVDGKNVLPLSACQDHKRRFDGDKGPNTGGMGAYSPVRLYDTHQEAIKKHLLDPIEKSLADGKLSFKGMLFAGILVGRTESEEPTTQLTPYVLEFNARFGDPETQALMPRLKSDLLPLLWACTTGNLAAEKVEWQNDASVCVVASAENYPETSSKGKAITVNELGEKAFLFHAGTQLDGDVLKTNGGRVLCVTALGETIEKARENAYKAIKKVSFDDMACRSDIALREVGRCLST